MLYGLEWTKPVALAELERLAAAVRVLGDPATIAVTEHWVCLKAGGRDLGMWRETGVWFEADSDGAMGDEPVTFSRIP